MICNSNARTKGFSLEVTSAVLLVALMKKQNTFENLVFPHCSFHSVESAVAESAVYSISPPPPSSTMTSIFKNPVNKTIDNLCKHLEMLQSDDSEKKKKAVSKLSEDISQIHFILYGDSDKDPNPDHISRLVPKLLQEDTDLFCKLAQFTTEFEFEAKKQTAGIMNYIIRRCSKYHADAYIKSKTDGQRHNVIIDCLLRGYALMRSH